MGSHLKRLDEVLLMGINKLCFKGETRKNITKLSLNTTPLRDCTKSVFLSIVFNRPIVYIHQNLLKIVVLVIITDHEIKLRVCTKY